MPELPTALGGLLGYGAIGLGLALAIVAAVILNKGELTPARAKATSQFMIFALALVTIGAALEFYKAYAANQAAQQAALETATLPDFFWDDFVFARTQRSFGAAPPIGGESSDRLKVGQSVQRSIALKPKQCVLYFAAVRPPARVQVTIDPASVYKSVGDYRGYYQTGEVCNSTEAALDAQLHLQADGISDSQYSMSTFDARAQYDGTPAALTPGNVQMPHTVAKTIIAPALAPAKTVTICTGEFEQYCAGPHDFFYSCGVNIDDRIKAGICPSSYKLFETNVKGGNHCGYSLVQVTCNAAPDL